MPDGLGTEQYDGWLMAEMSTNNHNSEWICVDHLPEILNGSDPGAQSTSNTLYAAEIYNAPNTNYRDNHEVPCAVCTKSEAAVGKKYLSSFVRWGRDTCPQQLDVQPVYDGWAGGSRYNNRGSAADLLCMPHAPRKSEGFDYGDNSGDQTSAEIARATYRTNGLPLLGTVNNYDVPCTVCTVPSPDVVTIPGRTSCPLGHTLMYSGYLMSSFYDTTTSYPSNYHESEYVCVDRYPTFYPSRNVDTNGYHLYPVELDSYPPRVYGVPGQFGGGLRGVCRGLPGQPRRGAAAGGHGGDLSRRPRGWGYLRGRGAQGHRVAGAHHRGVRGREQHPGGQRRRHGDVRARLVNRGVGAVAGD